jgi:hypothetical protein
MGSSQTQAEAVPDTMLVAEGADQAGFLPDELQESTGDSSARLQ